VTTRFRRLTAGTVLVIGLGATLSACGNDGAALAKQACTHVNRSLTLLTQASRETDATVASQLMLRSSLASSSLMASCRERSSASLLLTVPRALTWRWTSS